MISKLFYIHGINVGPVQISFIEQCVLFCFINVRLKKRIRDKNTDEKLSSGTDKDVRENYNFYSLNLNR